jgi:hypothetical protein
MTQLIWFVVLMACIAPLVAIVKEGVMKTPEKLTPTGIFLVSAVISVLIFVVRGW